MNILLLGCAVAALVSGAQREQAKLGPNEYRVKVEAIVKPTDDLAIYRVQVWTTGKMAVDLSGIDTRGILGGESAQLESAGLYRTDFVLLFALRQHPEPKWRGKQLQLEERYIDGNVGSQVNIIRTVDTDTNVGKILELNPGLQTLNKDTKFLDGKVNGLKLEISVPKP